MKPKVILLIVVLALGGTAITVVSIRVQQQKKDEQTLRNVQATNTNMMQQLKPITSPPIFPEKK
jgi:uncharacterized protein HemX